MKPCRVSFVVTVHNKQPYLGELLESLTDQDVAGGAEIVVVDDHSTDGSIDALARAAAGLRPRFAGRILLVRLPHNAGPSVAVNAGIAAAGGEWLHFVDGDDRLPRGTTNGLLRLVEGQDVDMIYGGKRHFGADGARRADFRPAPPQWHAPAIDALIARRLVGIRFMARRATVVAAGGADEAVFVQDVSLPMRTALRARRLAVVETPVVEVRDAAGSLSGNPTQELHDFVLAAAGIAADTDLSASARRRLLQRCHRRLWRHLRWAPSSLPHLGAFVAAALGIGRPRATGLGTACAALRQGRNVRRPVPLATVPSVQRLAEPDAAATREPARPG